MDKVIQFHNTPGLVREFVNNWLIHAKKDKKVQPAQLAMLEDVLQLMDIAISVLKPQSESEKEQ